MRAEENGECSSEGVLVKTCVKLARTQRVDVSITC